MEAYDFSGWATKNDLKCSDGRTIRAGAFKENHGKVVPLCWQHGHSEPTNVLGHALLENRANGVYAYCKFNDTEQGKHAKLLVQHGDIVALSIYANELVEQQKNVLHGNIRELSLVLSGANPGAFIDNIVLKHGDSETSLEDEAIIYTGLALEHSNPTWENYNPDTNEGDNMAKTVQHDSEADIQSVFDSMNEEQREVVMGLLDAALHHSDEDNIDDDSEDEVIEHADGEKTIKEVFDSMNEEQKNVLYYMVAEAMGGGQSEAATHSDSDDKTLQHDQEGGNMTTHNIFEGQKDESKEQVLSHSDMLGILKDAKAIGSVRDAVMGYALKHGIEDIDILFPDAKAVTTTPEFIKRRTEWVAAVMNGTNHTPFSRIKSLFADITLDEARAKGYIKGNFKKEEFFSLAKRTTTPQTIYKKQKLDRDDVVDITDFDVVAWLKGEMRLMLEEELARAILMGDGRSNADEDKINETNIRPIATDDELYQTTVYVNIDDADSSIEEVIDALTLHRRHYRGSGNPTFYTSETVLSKMLLIKDGMGRRIYNSVADLAVALRVREIVPVEVMEDAGDLIGIMVNLQDYNVGADRGGAVAMFDDFDIDYNQQKYLIETRVSGALVKYKAALVVRKVASTDVLVAPVAPDFTDNVVTVATTTGVVYKDKLSGDTLTTGSPVTLDVDETLTVIAVPAAGYYFSTSADDEWKYDYQA